MNKLIHIGLAIIFVSSSAWCQKTQRIISLDPGSYHWLKDLGLSSNIIARSNWTSSDNSLPAIGDASKIYWDQILNLKPDVLISMDIENEEIPIRSKKWSWQYIQLESKKLQNIDSNLNLLQRQFQIEESKITALKNSWSEDLKKLEQISVNKKYIFILDVEPFFIAGKSSFMGQVLSICGLKNAAPKPNSYQKLDLESAYRIKTDTVVVQGEMLRSRSKKEIGHFLNQFPSFKNKKIVYLQRDQLTQFRLSLAKEAWQLCQALQP